MKRYGGAYDIGEYDYFTKEEIVEFAETVAEDVSAEVGSTYEVSDVYVDFRGNKQVLVVALTGEDWEYEVQEVIDFRRIHKPTDLFKVYLDGFVNSFVTTINKFKSGEV